MGRKASASLNEYPNFKGVNHFPPPDLNNTWRSNRYAPIAEHIKLLVKNGVTKAQLCCYFQLEEEGHHYFFYVKNEALARLPQRCVLIIRYSLLILSWKMAEYQLLNLEPIRLTCSLFHPTESNAKEVPITTNFHRFQQVSTPQWRIQLDPFFFSSVTKLKKRALTDVTRWKRKCHCLF